MELDQKRRLTLDGAPVDVLVLWFLQRRVLVEQVGDEGQVEFGVAADDICRHDELSASEPVGLIQHALGPLQVLLLLQRERRVGGRLGDGLVLLTFSDIFLREVRKS